MSDKHTVTISSGFGIGIISLILSVLKIAGVAPIAAWSWWWVTVFWWGPVALVLLVVTLYIILSSLIK